MITWRFDIENMPKDGTDFLAYAEYGATVVKYGGPWHLPGFIRSDQPASVTHIVAWCPINKPEVPA